MFCPSAPPKLSSIGVAPRRAPQGSGPTSASMELLEQEGAQNVGLFPTHTQATLPLDNGNSIKIECADLYLQ